MSLCKGLYTYVSRRFVHATYGTEELRTEQAGPTWADKVRQSTMAVVDAVRSTTGRVDQAARDVVATVQAGAGIATEKVLGSTGGMIVGRMSEEPLVGDVICGAGTDQVLHCYILTPAHVLLHYVISLLTTLSKCGLALL